MGTPTLPALTIYILEDEWQEWYTVPTSLAD